MEHRAAVQEKLTERYLLNELAPAEREDFEEHFFSCAECADDVRLGASFVANAKEVLRTGSLAPERAASRSPVSRWFEWLWSPAPAYALALLLAIFTVQQRFVLQRGLAPQLVTSTALRPATRGDAQIIRLQPNQPVFQITADVPRGLAVVWEFRNQAGETVFKMDAPADTTSGTLYFLLPADRFPDGSYKLVIQGKAREAAGSAFEEKYDFVIRR
jgi:hypothetical protein